MFDFSQCKSPEEAKSLYRKLAREHHPDFGGDLETMKALNVEFSAWSAKAARTGAYERQRTAHAEGKKSAADFHNMDEVEKAIFEKINFALNLAGIDIELMGLWVWISGDTKTHKEALKAEGFKWHAVKKVWFYAGIPSWGGKKTMEELRQTYGSTSYRNEEQKQERHAEALHS